jgi:hypothetical protein
MNIKIPYIIKGDITELFILSLGKQYTAIIDTKNLHLLDGKSISMQRDYIAVSSNSKTKLLHQLIKPEWKMIDHINRLPADNREQNLRETNHSLNMHNSNTNNTTGFPNVTREGNRFRAFLRHNKRPISIGRFNTVEEANIAVIEYKNNNGLL